MTLVTLMKAMAVGMTPLARISLVSMGRCPLGSGMTLAPGLTAVNGQPLVRIPPCASVPNTADPLIPGRLMTLTARDTALSTGAKADAGCVDDVTCRSELPLTIKA